MKTKINGNEIELKKGNLLPTAKKYVEQRRLKKFFDKIADRIDFIEDLKRLEVELGYVREYFEKEIRLMESNKFPVEKMTENPVEKLKSYDVWSWKKLVKKWEKEL